MAPRIGQLLMKAGILSNEQLERGLKEQRTYGGKIGTNLIELGFITDSELAQFLADQYQLQAVNSSDFEAIPRSIIDLVPRDLAEKHRMVPIHLDKRLTVAISDPNDLKGIDELGHRSQKAVQAVIAPEIWIVAALERYYNIPRDIRYLRWVDGREAAGPEISRIIVPVAAGDAVAEKATTEKNTPWDAYRNKLVTSRTKEEVFDALLAFLGQIYPRVAVYVLRKNQVAGWVVRGFPIRAKDFLGVQIPIETTNFCGTVMTSMKPFLGAAPADAGSKLLLDPLGLSAGQLMEVYPVIFRGQGIAAVMALQDHVTGLRDPYASKMADLACQRTGMALEMVALKRQLMA